MPSRTQQQQQHQQQQPSAHAYFEPRLGFLTGGAELHSAFMTVAEASRWCTDRRACRGFSGHAPFPSDGPAAVVYLSAFGKGAELVQHPEWVSYVRLTTADYDEQDEQDDQAGDVVEDAKLEL